MVSSKITTIKVDYLGDKRVIFQVLAIMRHKINLPESLNNNPS